MRNDLTEYVTATKLIHGWKDYIALPVPREREEGHNIETWITVEIMDDVRYIVRGELFREIFEISLLWEFWRVSSFNIIAFPLSTAIDSISRFFSRIFVYSFELFSFLE